MFSPHYLESNTARVVDVHLEERRTKDRADNGQNTARQLHKYMRTNDVRKGRKISIPQG
ncbi:hypothetical protein PAXRUDRAFT_829279 [Paxillus rubicundulus Ve08.2h10]|uniref:Uncharacterized protein n=1 Tax=Paxillus rubicundulus Ve08.2h10 TaxID=930991 RepID=A0A0D0D847_9AGAM|nr:hypothetical protein PAXRUDRAFT_829279 [Paxillus rubicundulus Ve08.2h10]